MSSRTTRAYREGNLGRIPASQRWHRVFFRSDGNRPNRDFLFHTIESFQCHWNGEMFKAAASIQERTVKKKFLSTPVSPSACLATSLYKVIFNRVKNDLLIAASTLPILKSFFALRFYTDLLHSQERWIWSNVKFDPSRKSSRNLNVEENEFTSVRSWR